MLAAAIVTVTAVIVAALAPKRGVSLTEGSVPERAVLAAEDIQVAAATHRPAVHVCHQAQKGLDAARLTSTTHQ